MSALFCYTVYRNINASDEEEAAKSAIVHWRIAEFSFFQRNVRHTLNWQELYDSGFRPVQDMRLKLIILDYNCGDVSVNGVLGFANRAGGKKAYMYAFINGTEMKREAAPLGDEYAFKFGAPELPLRNNIVERKLITGPPVLFIWARVPSDLPGTAGRQ